MLHLVDPLDGGFFRYAAAADWSGPHTEKVTLDQAALIALFLEASIALEAPDYRHVALRALELARQRLADAEGRVYASIAAAPREAVDRRRFADAGAALARAGLLAATLTGEATGLVLEAPAVARDGGVPHRLDAPPATATPRGLLRDQALSIAAAVDAYRLSGDPVLLDWASRAAEWSLAHLWDKGRGAFRDAPAVPGDRPAPFFTPLIGNGDMAQALLALADHGGEEKWRRVAADAVATLAAEAARSPAGATLALAAQRLASEPTVADIEGEPADPRAPALARAVVAALGPPAVVRWRASTAAPCVTVCVGVLCLPALAEPSEVSETLRYTERQ
jgi:uncharacterized protein